MTDATSEKKKGSLLGKGLLIVVGILIAITVLGAIVGEDKDVPASPSASASSQGDVAALAPIPTAEPVVEDQASMLTGPQRNAVRSAQQYLAMAGFSRAGLIDQLSSDAGEGYDLSDATIAVDSLAVDWNEQAARSASKYLEMSGFSCRGLIDQLSSEYGEQFTKSQAKYGAEQAGAC